MKCSQTVGGVRTRGRMRMMLLHFTLVLDRICETTDQFFASIIMNTLMEMEGWMFSLKPANQN